MVHRGKASLQYETGCASSKHLVWRKLAHSNDRCTYQAFLVSALFCHSSHLRVQGMTGNTVRRSWVNWEISAGETFLLRPRVVAYVPGVLQSTGHPRAAGQQMARREAQGPAGVWLLSGNVQFAGAGGRAGPAGRSTPEGSPDYRAPVSLEMQGLQWLQLQTVQIAAFQDSR